MTLDYLPLAFPAILLTWAMLLSIDALASRLQQ